MGIVRRTPQSVMLRRTDDGGRTRPTLVTEELRKLPLRRYTGRNMASDYNRALHNIEVRFRYLCGNMNNLARDRVRVMRQAVGEIAEDEFEVVRQFYHQEES